VAVKVAEEWLNICGGCEVTILDIGEPLLDLLPELNFVARQVKKQKWRFQRQMWESSQEVCGMRRKSTSPRK